MRDAKIGQEHAAIARHKDVARLDVTVDHVPIVRIVQRTAQLLHNWKRLHRRELSAYALQQVFERAGRYEGRHHIEQVLALAIFEEWEDIWMVKLPDLLRLAQKIVAERCALSIAGTKYFYRYLIALLASGTSAVNVGHASSAHTLQQQIVAQHDAF